MNRQIYVGIVFLINSFITYCPSFIILKTKRKYNPIICLTALIIWDFIFFTLPRILGIAPSAPRTILAGVLPPFIWHFIFFNEPVWKRLFMPFSNILLTFAIDQICLNYLLLIIGGSYDDIISQNEYFLASIALYNMILLAANILFILFWQRIIDRKKNNYMILYLVITLYQLILMSMFISIRKNISTHVMQISMIFLLASFLIDILIYYFFNHIEKMLHTKAQISSLYFEKEALREYQVTEKQNIQKLETLRNEFVQQMQAVLNLVQEKTQSCAISETLLQSNAILERARQEFYSPIPVLNALFTIKAHHASELGIDITINCIHSANLKIDDIELCSVTGNLMDNALEACSQSEHAPRTVHAYVTQKANYLIIKVENTIGSGFILPPPEIKTTKSDALNHGIGLKLVEKICEQYNGSFTLTPLSKNMICATAILKERGI